MNKIYIDKAIYELKIKKNDFYSLEITQNTNLKLKILANLQVTFNILITNSQVNIDLEILTNSKVTINQLGINSSCNISVKLIDNSYLTYYYSLLTKTNSLNKIEFNLLNNATCNFFSNAINLNNSKVYFTIDGKILKETNNVTLCENSKIINLSDGDSKIIPNLIVDSKEVLASHSAFIGTFDKNQINYLKSRGLNDKQVQNILLKATLLSSMNLEYEKDKFTNIIIKNQQ